MNYIYDILVNFNSRVYDFFEWNYTDDITHIKKIPLFRVETDVLKDFVNNKVKLSPDFVSKIDKKSEIFNKNKKLNYAFLATDGSEVICFKVMENGLINKYSKLLSQEEDEVLEYSLNIDYSKIDYEVINKIEIKKERNVC